MANLNAKLFVRGHEQRVNVVYNVDKQQQQQQQTSFAEMYLYMYMV